MVYITRIFKHGFYFHWYLLIANLIHHDSIAKSVNFRMFSFLNKGSDGHIRAFRHIKMDPLDYDLLGLLWLDVYVDTCILFGRKHGSQIFQHCSDAVHFIMRKMGHKIIGYIDDFVRSGIPSDERMSFDCLYGLLQELGVTISSKMHSGHGP